MSANGYDVAAEAPIVNTYVPINFGELYRIGAAQKAAVDEAVEDLNTAVTTFGEFRSPSKIDTENYYKNSIGKFTDLIEAASSNPDLMKDAGFRAQLQSRINGLDYTALSMLKESADMQRLGIKTRAQMESEGRYNKDWDKSDIPNYDTLGTGRVFDDITPVRWMSANELSNAYFNDLKASSLGSVWKDGVKYNRTGITYDTLYDISSARFNDLVNTPQGKEYYNQFLQQYGNADDAREAFVTMIADSQRDRIVNQDTVDPYWLTMARTNSRGANNIASLNPTRLDFINSTVAKSSTNSIGRRFEDYRNYINGLIDKYPDTEISKNAKRGLANIDNMLHQMQYLGMAANEYMKDYNKSGSNQSYVNAVTASNQAKQIQSKLLGMADKYVLKNEFERVSKFSADDINNENKYSTEGYLRGVKSALDLVKGDIGVLDNDDLLTGVGGVYEVIKDENGGRSRAYSFNDSEGFILPETAFQIATETQPRNIKIESGLFRDDSFPVKELIESGSIPNVQFIPDNKVMKLDPNTFALFGKMRIPKEIVEQALGTGIWSDKGWTSGFSDKLVLPFGRQSTRTAMKDLFGGKEVKEIIGENGEEYYEIDILRTLPSYNQSPEYWQRVNQRWQGGQETGIGGASQAKEEYNTSAQQTLGY